MKIKSFLILATALVMVACGGNTSNKSNNEEAEAVAATATAMDIDALLSSAEELAGKEVEIEGICTHICSHGGRKIFLMGSDDTKTIRIEAGELGAFDQKCVNSIVKVKGILNEERIDEAYLKQWEALNAANAAEEHGDGEGGCSTEKAARGETGNTVEERIAGFRARIAERKASEGKEYLSFYFVLATAYEVVE
ncbi:MAG: hypothetical protein J6R90_01860 [Alistipes sp.]|nr:hypothetical protein [Alistipes sp.]